MSMNQTPSANRLHIGFFGRRNAGKSSVVNAVTNQEMSVVSDVKGTTTDPVAKSMELPILGPVLIIDTPGYDDCGDLGELRVRKTKQILNKTDIAVLVVDATLGIGRADNELIKLFDLKKIPYIIVYNKCDLLTVHDMKLLSQDVNVVLVSATDKKNIDQLKEKLTLLVDVGVKKQLAADLVEQGDIVLLVVPIDSSAPKGRLILPQQQVIRDLLEAGAITIVVGQDEVSTALTALNKKPKLVITDSQIFAEVSKIIPSDIYLTSFSILMARYKGFLSAAVHGAMAIDGLKDMDKVLICEGCTHHRQCNDIGTVKLPAWLLEYTGKSIICEFVSGGDFPEDISEYKVIIHCGGCMLNEREVSYRMKCAKDCDVPFTNYGTVIAMTKGILTRSIEIFHGVYDYAE